MKTFHVILGYDVPCYHTVVIQARNAAEAELRAEQLLNTLDSSLFEPEWDMARDHRVVDIIAAEDVKPVRV